MRAIFLILIGLSSLSFAEFSKENDVVHDDSTTKLEWQDDYGDNAGDIKYTTWQNAIDYCEALSLDGGGWRLPNVRELESIVDDSTYAPSISSVFELTNSSYYWSSTGDNSYAAIISFYNNTMFHTEKNNNHYVRCVRTGE